MIEAEDVVNEYGVPLLGKPLLEFLPAVELSTGRLLGFEALLRWEHPTKGRIPPSALIPWAEENGAIVALTQWVMRGACEQANRWGAGIQLSVNCSLLPLHQGEASKAAAAALAASGLNPDRLSIEVTERTVADDRAAADLRALSALGVHLAVDDVGTSWSSLQPLKRLNVEIVKVDQPFVNSLEADGGMNRAIVEAIIHVAHSLNMTTVAEGIESAEQVTILKEFGADVGQGYFFAHPLSADATADLASTEPRPVFQLGPTPAPSHLAPVADEDDADDDVDGEVEEVVEAPPNPFASRRQRPSRIQAAAAAAATAAAAGNASAYVSRRGATAPRSKQDSPGPEASDSDEPAPMPMYLRRRGAPPMRHKPQGPLGMPVAAGAQAAPATAPAVAASPALAAVAPAAPATAPAPAPATVVAVPEAPQPAAVAVATVSPAAASTASAWFDDLMGGLLDDPAAATQGSRVDIVADSREVVQAVAEAFDRSA